MNWLLRFAFRHFYTTFAWTYDAVAAGVSFGEWQTWGRAALTQVPPAARILELAHGPGHLHLHMRQCGLDVVSLDLSPQMGQLLRARMRRAGLPLRQLQATAQHLPYANAQFDCVLSTFPTDFIFAPDTLRDIWRVLAPNGRLIIVPSVEITGQGLSAALVRSAYRLTGQHAYDAEQQMRIRERFSDQHFGFAEHRVATRHAQVVVWVCAKS